MRALFALVLLLPLGCEPAQKRTLPDPGKTPASVTFETEPPGGTVVVDGVTLGPAPQEVKLKPGMHRVEARKSGYFKQSQSLSLTANEARAVRLTLVASH